MDTINHGQNKNHQNSIETATTKYIWRIDDDLIFGNKVLSSLYSSITQSPEIGAVAPRVFMPNNSLKFSEVSGSIVDIYTKAGVQLCVDNNGKHNVQHLHCCFLYDRTTNAKYLKDLSLIGFREESAFSHDLYRLGYKLIVDLDTEVYHIKAEKGGARCEDFAEYKKMVEHDEQKFYEYLQNTQRESSNRDYTEWLNSIEPAKTPFYYLNNGIGDHFAFKQLIPELLLKYDKLKILHAPLYAL